MSRFCSSRQENKSREKERKKKQREREDREREMAVDPMGAVKLLLAYSSHITKNWSCLYTHALLCKSLTLFRVQKTEDRCENCLRLWRTYMCYSFD